MVLEQPSELPAADAQPLGQRFHAGLAVVQRALGDQGQRPADGVGRAAPEGEVRCDFRSATQAGTEARLLCGGGRGEEPAVLEPRHAGRADRPAVDAGRGHAHEDAAVEPGIMRLEDAVAGSAVQQFHNSSFPRPSAQGSRFPDPVARIDDRTGRS